MRLNNCSHGSFFTLIELLVVIGIIGILASMLLPALKMARESAMKSYCMSNLKQLGIVTYNYSSDYNGFLPAHITTMGGSNYLFNLFLHELGYVSGEMGESDSAAVTKGLFSCPSESAAKTAAGNNWNRTNYGINTNVCQNFYGDPYYICHRITQVRKPSIVCFLGDSGGALSGSRTGDRLSAAADRLPDLRHLQGWNVLYVDGHTGYKKDYPLNNSDEFWNP